MIHSGLAIAVLLGVIQGITEFLPLSSSGHLASVQVLFPSLATPGVTLELATHLGTAVAVLVSTTDICIPSMIYRAIFGKVKLVAET